MVGMGSAGRVVRGRVVTPAAVLDDGAVVLDGDRIAWVGTAGDVPAPWQDAVGRTTPDPDTYVLPGLVDLHCHGGGGAGFPDATDAQTVRVAVAEHRRHGTTTLVASLVTAPPEVLRERTVLLAELADAGEIAGIHFEGPFISAERCGAQDPAAIQAPDTALTAELLELAAGHGRTMTLAPEIPGAVGPGGVLETLVAAGALPSFGHTAASGAQIRAAVGQAGALLAGSPTARSRRPTVTHLFNGMAPVHHRSPGPVPELLAAARQGRVVLELIADGTHVETGLVRNVVEIVGRENVVLVTDAMAAAGMADGDYQLGSLAVTVRDGVARLTHGGAIAGGTCHLIDVVRTCVAGGIDVVDAVYMASTGPAEVLGDPRVGALEAGRRADLVRTDVQLHPIETIRRGRAT